MSPRSKFWLLIFLILFISLQVPLQTQTTLGNDESPPSNTQDSLVKPGATATQRDSSPPIKPRPFEELIELAKNPDEWVRHSAAQELGYHWPTSKKLLHTLLKDLSPEVQVMAAGALLVHGDRSGEGLIDELMQSRDHDALIPASAAICSQEPSNALTALEKIMFSKKKPYVQKLSAAMMLDGCFEGEGSDAERLRIDSSLNRFFGTKTVEKARAKMDSQMKKFLQ